MKHDSHLINMDATLSYNGTYGTHSQVWVWYKDTQGRTRTLRRNAPLEEALQLFPNAQKRFILRNEETGHASHVGKDMWEQAVYMSRGV